jgi:hypothetical protein
MPPKIREVVEPEQLKEELLRCKVSPKRLDDLMEGLIFSLATRPERLRRDDPTGWSRIMIREASPDIPAIRVWFTYDDDKVNIERVDLLSEYL